MIERRWCGPERANCGVGADPAGDLELDAEPAGVLVPQLLHRADQAEVVDERRDLLGVLLGEREEQRVLVGEVVEDRAARQPGLLLEAADRGALVAICREGPPGAVEDPAAGGFESLRATPWAWPKLTKPYVRLAIDR